MITKTRILRILEQFVEYSYKFAFNDHMYILCVIVSDLWCFHNRKTIFHGLDFYLNSEKFISEWKFPQAFLDGLSLSFGRFSASSHNSTLNYLDPFYLYNDFTYKFFYIFPTNRTTLVNHKIPNKKKCNVDC